VATFALLLVLAPPLALLTLEAIAHRASERWSRGLHLVLVGLLAGVLAWQVAYGAGAAVRNAAVVAGALAAGAAFTRWAPVRSLATAVGAASFVVLALFLLTGPVSHLVLRGPPEAIGATGAQGTPVVMVVLDELPLVSLLDADDRIDAARAPHLARLAQEADWYRRATTVADGTYYAVPALLTGRLPERDRLPAAADHPESLFTLLRSTHRLNVAESLTFLCTMPECARATRGSFPRQVGRHAVAGLAASRLPRDAGVSVGTWLNDLNDPGAPAPDPQVAGARGVAPGPAAGPPRPGAVDAGGEAGAEVARFREFIASIRSDPPALDYLHVQLPHIPWNLLPSGQRYTGSSRPGELPGLGADDRWSIDPGLAAYGWQRHLLQVSYTDRLIGDLVARLRELGIYDRALIVVTADHGASFQPGELRRRTTARTAGDILRVPLLVKRPGQGSGRILDGPARTVDVLPTIAKTLGARIPWTTEGGPLPGVTGPPAGPLPVFAGDRATGFALDLILHGSAETVARQTAIFGKRRGSPYAAGGARGLIGRPVASLRLRDVDLELRGPPLRVADPRGPLVPAAIAGTVEAPQGARIVIAVNGTVAATATASGTGARTAIHVVVDPATLRSGTNEVAAYVARRP
jgi:hypothetical protein